MLDLSVLGLLPEQVLLLIQQKSGGALANAPLALLVPTALSTCSNPDKWDNCI